MSDPRRTANDEKQGRPRARPAVYMWSCAVLIAAAVCSTGCRSKPPATDSARGSPSAADRHDLRPVAVPAFDGAPPTVLKQLRERSDALTAKIHDAGSSDPDLANAYGEMGKLLMAAEYRDAAEPYFVNAEALAPTDGRWPYYLAHLYKLRGESAKSLSSFERALRLRPDDVATLVWLAAAYLDDGRAADAEPLLLKALAREPRSVAVLFGLGRVALANQQYSRAADYLEQALSIDPHASVIEYPLALAYRGMRDFTKAEEHLRRRGPGEVRPTDPLMTELDAMLETAVAYEVRGAQALDEGQWAAAADYFRKGVELAPDEPSLRHKLGTALAMMGDGQAAFREFDEVARRWPKFPKGQYSLGVMLASNGRYREAIDHLSAAVRSDPGYVEARLQLAEALRATGRFDDSLTQYQEVSRLDPRVAEARLGYAMSLAALGRFKEARDHLAEDMKVYPNRPEFAAALARLPAPAPDRR